MVDEFQDTNDTQYRILSHLIKPNPATLFAVADDDQIIYQWNGADPQRIEALKKDFSVSILQLPKNYRCPPEIIGVANALISNNLNQDQNKKPLIAIKSGSVGRAIEIYKFPELDNEVDWIARQIAQKSDEEKNNTAVLARANKLLAAIHAKMAELSIPVYLAARKSDFNSAPFHFLYSMLRLANFPNDKRAFAKLIKSFYELEGMRLSVPEILSKASASGETFLRIWLAEVLHRSELDKETKEFLIVGMKPLLASLDFIPFSKNVVSWAKTKQATLSESDEAFSKFAEEEKVWNQIANDITKKFADTNISLHQFLHELDLTSKTPARKDGSVCCFSIHASKGMEFGHVYLMGLVEDQLPSWAAVKKGSDSLEMQEERRNCFVAITRAKEKLTLTFSDAVFGWSKAPSRFLSEMGFSLR
jgi:DNA helicase-2/ATP-dependent DNA helicase PcrA